MEKTYKQRVPTELSTDFTTVTIFFFVVFSIKTTRKSHHSFQFQQSQSLGKFFSFYH